jgi:CheY-like chemotaxis protein
LASSPLGIPLVAPLTRGLYTLMRRVEMPHGRLQATIGSETVMATKPFTVDDEPRRCRPGHILIGDPDPDTRQLYRECLKEFGLDIIGAATGPEAIAMALLHKPTLFITELFMPWVDGFTLCKTWRKATLVRSGRILVVTTESRPIQLARALAAGADVILSKPIQLDCFVRRCVELLAAARTPAITEERQAVRVARSVAAISAATQLVSRSSV